MGTSTALLHDPPAVKAAGLLLPSAPDGRVRFSREAIHRPGEMGILGRDSRVEFVEGEILMMSSIESLHGAIARGLTRFFVKNLPDLLECRLQPPFSSEDQSRSHFFPLSD